MLINHPWEPTLPTALTPRDRPRLQPVPNGTASAEPLMSELRQLRNGALSAFAPLSLKPLRLTLSVFAFYVTRSIITHRKYFFNCFFKFFRDSHRFKYIRGLVREEIRSRPFERFAGTKTPGAADALHAGVVGGHNVGVGIADMKRFLRSQT